MKKEKDKFGFQIEIQTIIIWVDDAKAATKGGCSFVHNCIHFCGFCALYRCFLHLVNFFARGSTFMKTLPQIRS